jgi:hypothetical protein
MTIPRRDRLTSGNKKAALRGFFSGAQEMNYAVILNGVVVNIILWDGVSPYTQPTDATRVEIPDGSSAGIGYTYASGAFTAPSD